MKQNKWETSTVYVYNNFTWTRCNPKNNKLEEHSGDMQDAVKFMVKEGYKLINTSPACPIMLIFAKQL